MGSRVASGRSRRSWHVRYASNSDPIGASQQNVALCQKETFEGVRLTRPALGLLDCQLGLQPTDRAPQSSRRSSESPLIIQNHNEMVVCKDFRDCVVV
jgi:hypothetical protein